MIKEMLSFLQCAAMTGTAIYAARLGKMAEVINQGLISSHPAVLSSNRKNGPNRISLPEGLDPVRLHNGIMLTRAITPVHYTYFSRALEAEHGGAITTGKELPETIATTPNTLRTMLTHRCREESHLQGILEDMAFRDRQMSQGVASQGGICLSSCIRAQELVEHMKGRDSKPRIWFSVAKDAAVQSSRSTSQMGDGTTYVCKEEQLPIVPHAVYLMGKGLEFIDPKRFVENNLVALNLRILANVREWANLAGYLLQVNSTGKASICDISGCPYTQQDLASLPPEELVRVVGENFVAFAQICDTMSFSNNAPKAERLLTESQKEIRELLEVNWTLMNHSGLQAEISNTGLDRLGVHLGPPGALDTSLPRP